MSKPKILYFNKYTTELHVGKLSDDDVAMVDFADYQHLLDANNKLREALEIISDSNHGKDCDLIADKVAKLALSEASESEGGL